MNISLSSIAASLLFSSIGLWLLKEARRRANLHLTVIAVVMILYTYLTSNPWADWGIGLALTYGAYYFWSY